MDLSFAGRLHANANAVHPRPALGFTVLSAGTGAANDHVSAREDDYRMMLVSGFADTSRTAHWWTLKFTVDHCIDG